MSALEHVESRNLSINSEAVDSTLEPELSLNESEAKEIDSCINFLSILDDDSSNDSCEFTLFRKKYDSPSKTLVGEHKKDQGGPNTPPRTDSSPELSIKNTSKLKSDKDVASCEIESNTLESVIDESSQDTSTELCLKTKSPKKLNVKFLPSSPTNIKVSPDFKAETKNLLEENLALKQNQSIVKPYTKAENNSIIAFSPNRKLPLVPKKSSGIANVPSMKVVKSPEGRKDLLIDKTLELKVSPKKSFQFSFSPRKSEMSTSKKLIDLSGSRKPLELKVSKKVTSPSFKATGTKSGQNILRISKLSSNSGTELNAGSVLQSAKNIVLKVSKVPKSVSLSPRDKLSNKYSEIKIKKLQKLQSTLTFSTKGGASNQSFNKTKLNQSPKFYFEGNSILPEKLSCNGEKEPDLNSKVSIAEFFHSSSFDLDPVVKSDNDEIQIHLVNEETIGKQSFNNSSKEEILVCDMDINHSPIEDCDMDIKHSSIEDCDMDIKHIPIEDLPTPFINTSETPVNDSVTHDLITKDEQNKCVESAERNDSKNISQEADSNSKTNGTNFGLSKVKPKSSKTTSKKRVKTRILAGGKSKKKKVNKVINLLKHPPPSLDKLGKKNEEEMNRYLPLVRTELPTFLKKLDSQENIPVTEPDKSHTPVVPDSSANEKNAEKVNDKKVNNQTSSQMDDESKSSSVDLTKNSNVPKPDEQTLVRPSEKDEAKDENGSLRKTSRDDHLELNEKVSDTHTLSEEKVMNLEKLTNQDSRDSLIHSNISQGAENTLPNNLQLNQCVEEMTPELLEFPTGRGLICDISTDSPVLSIPDSLFPENEEFNLLIPPVLSENESNGVSTDKKEDNNETKIKESVQEDSSKNMCKDSAESRSSNFIYSYNKFSPLSFTVQNILEHTFKYESYPSSSNMARLAKIMEVHWKDVRDWFLARRYLNKKNGIFTRNQVLSMCPVCPRFHPAPNEPSLVHLLNKDHLHNMTKFIQKDYEIFRKFQNSDSYSSVECRTDLSSQETDLSPYLSQERIQTPDPKKEPLITSTLKSSAPKPVGNKSEQIQISSSRAGDKNEKETKGKLDSFLNLSAKSEPGRTIEEIDKSTKKFGGCRTDTRIYIGYRCPDCFKIFQSEWMLIRHAISHKQLICSECNETFLREDLLQHHFKEHIIESLDTTLYPMFLCFKCCSLNCICLQENHYIPNVRTKHYLRPQMAKRSKPFISVPYSNVNERLKVTISEFLQEIRKPQNKKSVYNNLSSGKKTQKKKDSKDVSPVPTYTNLTTFNCDICESFFFTEDELKEHLTVHRIQARSREKTERRQKGYEGPTRKDASSPEFRKPSSFLSSLYFCSYCSKGYKREATLCKHLKFECKVLPKSISNMLYNGCSFNVVNIGKGNKYGIKLVKPPSPVKASKPKVKCKSVPETPPPVEISNEKWDKKDTSKSGLHNGFIPAGKEEEKTLSEYFFLCSYCNIPFDSETLLGDHIRESCSSAPPEVKVEVQMHSLLELEQLGKGSHYRKVKRNEILKILTPKKIRLIFDMSICRFQKRNQRKVKCKFCNQSYMIACLKLHLFKQCKCIPEEVKNVLIRHKSLLKYSHSEPPSFDHESEGKVTTPKEESKPDDDPFNEMERTPSAVEILSSPSKESIEPSNDSPTKPIMLYDCHLCEEKFKFSKDFILHMSHFHCMNISEESSCKWLVTPKKETDASGSGMLSPSPTKTPSENADDENIIEHDANLENIAETLVVSSDYSLTREEQNRLASPVRRGRRRKNSTSLNDHAFKSQKLEDEEIFEDLDDNLDNFIETVQLEDHNFNSVAS